MRRRELLGSGIALLAGAVAGCLGHPDRALDLREATDQELVDEVAVTVDESELMGAAVENGSATAFGERRLETDAPVGFDGAYYNVSRTRVGERTVYSYDIRFDYDPADPTPDRGEIDYESLPAVDRRELQFLFPPEENATGEGYDVDRQFITTEETREMRNESVLIPQQQYDVLIYEGEPYPFEVVEKADTEPEFEYTATEIAGSTAAYADQLRAEYLVSLTGLSEGEREVLDTAIDDGYRDDGNEDGYDSLIDRLQSQQALESYGSYGGEWLVEYDGTQYIADADYSASVVE